MPINRKLYPSDWSAISKRIREREGQRCLWCKAPNGEAVARGVGSAAGTYMLFDGHVFDDETGEALGSARGSEYNAKPAIRIVLTVSHLDRDTQNNHDSNLAALCQQCHLRHDKHQHVASARKTRRERKAHKELFE